MTLLHPTRYRYRHYRGDDLIWASDVGDLDGSIRRGTPGELEVIDAQLWRPNELANEGETLILDVFFRGATAPTNLFFRLSTDTPTDNDTLAGVTEVAGTGYAAISLNRNSTDFPTLEVNAGASRVISATKTFTAGGTWTGATHLYLATTSDNTGKLVAYNALSATRTLVNGDTLAVDMTISLD